MQDIMQYEDFIGNEARETMCRLSAPPPAPKKKKPTDNPIRIIEKNFWHSEMLCVFEIAIGLSQRLFTMRQIRLMVSLGKSLHYPNGKSQWSCRKTWEKTMRRSSLDTWKKNEITESGEKQRKLTFNTNIDICLIPPKEGEDFDIETVSKENCRDYEKLSTPLYPEEEYVEIWARSPYRYDNGTMRPYYTNVARCNSQGWCVCNHPPARREGQRISWK